MLARPFQFINNHETGLLFIHGFTASPSELLPTAQLLHEKGIDVYGPLLPGHGTTVKQLEATTWQDWYRCVKENVTQLLPNYQRLFIAGLSMGGLLALLAAVEIAELAGVIAINAPIYYKNRFINQWSIGFLRRFRTSWPKKEGNLAGRFAYSGYPLQAFYSMQQLRKLVMMKIEEVSIPAMIVQSEQDEVIRAKSAAYVARALNIPINRMLVLSDSYHIATMGSEKDKLTEQMASFIQEVTNAIYTLEK